MPEPERARGLIVEATAAIGLVGGLLAAITAFQPQWAAFAALGYFGWLGLASALVVAAVVLFLARRRKRSRLLDPDALRLDPSNADHLVGRAGEIGDLARICDASGLVFLSGDSGTGKSALVRSGLVPTLAATGRWRPIVVDMADRDFDRGPCSAMAEAFWRALPDTERTRLGMAAVPLMHRALKGLRLSFRASGLRPLIVLDQIDDYQLRHRERFLSPQLHTWQPTSSTLAASRFWRWLAAAVKVRNVGALLVTRSDNYSALESLRLLPEPASYPLGRLPSGFVGPIVERLTRRAADAPPVVADPEAGWTALVERLGVDLESGGLLLPQQLKTVLLGLRGLRPLNVHGYDRVGGAEGLEALFVEGAVRDAAGAAGLRSEQVRDLLLAMVDRKERRKGEALSAGQLATSVKIPTEAVVIERALHSLSAPGRELVRPTAAGWQLDHDYLARGILKAEANAEWWPSRLAERARQHRDAAGAWRWWRTLLSPWEQAAFALAWLRRKRPYGENARFAGMSVLRLLPVAGVAFLLLSAAYSTGQFLHSSTVLNTLGFDDDLSTEEAAALVDLAGAPPMTRGLVAWRSFQDPSHARKADDKAAAIVRAIARLDGRNADYLRDWIIVPALASPIREIRIYAAASTSAIDNNYQSVMALLNALVAAKGDPFATASLAEAYAAAAQKLPEDKAPAAVAAVLDALVAAKGDSRATATLAEAYAAA
ncbi:MAG: hypothetical protein WAS21_21770, partial [Geminicoccaceae bacterium]